MQALDLLVPLGNAHLPPLEAEAGAAAAGPACLTMTGIGAWMMTWKDAHARGKLPVLKEAFLAAVVVELALRGRPVREAGLTEMTALQLERRISMGE